MLGRGERLLELRKRSEREMRTINPEAKYMKKIHILSFCISFISNTNAHLLLS
jgi:hypothetical protein